FNSNYLTYEGGKTDFLGFDDGTRSIPTGMRTDIPVYTDVVGRPDSDAGSAFRQILEGFNPTLAAVRATSSMDYSVGLGIGNQVGRDNNTWGYTLALSYANTTEYYDDAQAMRATRSGRYWKHSTRSGLPCVPQVLWTTVWDLASATRSAGVTIPGAIRFQYPMPTPRNITTTQSSVAMVRVRRTRMSCRHVSIKSENTDPIPLCSAVLPVWL